MQIEFIIVAIAAFCLVVLIVLIKAVTSPLKKGRVTQPKQEVEIEEEVDSEQECEHYEYESHFQFVPGNYYILPATKPKIVVLCTGCNDIVKIHEITS